MAPPVTNGINTHKRPLAELGAEPGGLPPQKKAKVEVEVIAPAVKMFMTSFSYLEDLNELFQLSRVSKVFRQAIRTYYALFPRFGSALEIYKRIAPAINRTQAREGRHYVRQEEVEQLCRYIEKYCKKLPPHQRLTFRTNKSCPRTVRLLGGTGYALFNRCQTKKDRSLSNGEGSFCQVKLCYELETGQERIWSTILCDDEETRTTAEAAVEMAKLTHGIANVGQFDHWVRFKSRKEGKPDKVGLIGAYYNSGNLDHFLTGKIATCSPGEIEKLACDIARGVAGLHRLNIVHRDLKPANVMIHQLPSGEREARIIDLGAACKSDNRKVMESYWSTTEDYYAPEICSACLNGEPSSKEPHVFTRAPSPTSFASDIWALGCVLYELTTSRELPFIRNDGDEQMKNIAALEDVELMCPESPDAPDAYRYIYEVIEDLLDVDPDERPSAEDALKRLEKCLARCQKELQPFSPIKT